MGAGETTSTRDLPILVAQWLRIFVIRALIGMPLTTCNFMIHKKIALYTTHT